MSPYYRAQIGYYILGIDPVMPMLDLIVLQASDCQESRTADLFDYLKLPAIRLGVTYQARNQGTSFVTR